MSEFSECGESFIPTRFIEWNLNYLILLFVFSYVWYFLEVNFLRPQTREKRNFHTKFRCPIKYESNHEICYLILIPC